MSPKFSKPILASTLSLPPSKALRTSSRVKVPLTSDLTTSFKIFSVASSGVLCLIICFIVSLIISH